MIKYGICQNSPENVHTDAEREREREREREKPSCEGEIVIINL